MTLNTLRMTQESLSTIDKKFMTWIQTPTDYAPPKGQPGPAWNANSSVAVYAYTMNPSDKDFTAKRKTACHAGFSPFKAGKSPRTYEVELNEYWQKAEIRNIAVKNILSWLYGEDSIYPECHKHVKCTLAEDFFKLKVTGPIGFGQFVAPCIILRDMREGRDYGMKTPYTKVWDDLVTTYGLRKDIAFMLCQSFDTSVLGPIVRLPNPSLNLSAGHWVMPSALDVKRYLNRDPKVSNTGYLPTSSSLYRKGTIGDYSSGDDLQKLYTKWLKESPTTKIALATGRSSFSAGLEYLVFTDPRTSLHELQSRILKEYK